MRSKVFIFLIVLISYFNLNETKPTFGDEFVHIKVHLPKEGVAGGIGDPHAHIHPGPAIHSSHPIVHAPVIPPPHIIHHYHKRRRPLKKPPTFGKHSGLLESIILSEVKKPLSSDHLKYLNHAEDIAKHVDTFLVKPEPKPKPHIETYKLIEETKPKEIVETFKVIENKIPKHIDHDHHLDISPTGTGTFDDGGYNYKPSKPVETYKVIDGLFDDYQTHIKDHHHHHDHQYHQYGSPKKQRVKTVKIIDEHDHESNDDHYGHDYATHSNSDGGGYHYGSKPHTETVKIIETKAPHQHEYSINFNKKHHGGDTAVEIVQTKTPSKSNSYYNNRHQQHQQQQGYQYEPPTSIHNGGGHYDDSYQTHNYHDHHETYKTIPDETYTQEPEDSYLPPKRPSVGGHHRHQQSQHQHQNHYSNSVYDHEGSSDSYLPPPLPDLDDGPTYGETTNYKAPTETYTGLDSYSAPHVQGFGSGGYTYPQPYP